MQAIDMRAKREELGLNADQVQMLCGISRSYLQKIDAGAKPAPASVRLVMEIMTRRPSLIPFAKRAAKDIAAKAEATGIAAHVVTLLRFSMENSSVPALANRMISSTSRSAKQAAAA